MGDSINARHFQAHDEATHPVSPLEPTRDLVYRYLSLSYSVRRALAVEFGVPMIDYNNEKDETMRGSIVLRHVKDAGRLEEFGRAIDRIKTRDDPINKATLAGLTETDREVAHQKVVEDHIAGLTWGPGTSEEAKCLVAGNLRHFYAKVCPLPTPRAVAPGTTQRVRFMVGVPLSDPDSWEAASMNEKSDDPAEAQRAVCEGAQWGDVGPVHFAIVEADVPLPLSPPVPVVQGRST